MTELYHILKKQYGHIVYVREINEYGHVSLVAKNINLKLLKKNHDLFVDFVYNSCLEALKISKIYNNTHFIVHIYLENATIKNVSMKLFNKLNKKLSNNLEDVLKICYVYGRGILLTSVINIIRLQLNPVTKKKFLLVKPNL